MSAKRCTKCGETKPLEEFSKNRTTRDGDKAEAHHEDYSRPLDVVWLCSLHHHRRHAEINRLKRDVADG